MRRIHPIARVIKRLAVLSLESQVEVAVEGAPKDPTSESPAFPRDSTSLH